MAELASRTSLGGALNDTFSSYVLARIFADGVYGWIPKSASADFFDVSTNLAGRRVIGVAEGQATDGYATKVTTNGLVYENRDGAYVVVDYQIDVATVAARDALSEMETNQRVRIDSEAGRVDTWDGSAWVEGTPETLLYATYATIPDPTTVRVGTTVRVTNDPADGLNGIHVATGAAPGSNATYWDAAN